MIPKEKCINLINEADDWLYETKKIIDARAGTVIEDPKEFELLDLCKQIMVNQILMKRYLLENYGITIMTKVNP